MILCDLVSDRWTMGGCSKSLETYLHCSAKPTQNRDDVPSYLSCIDKRGTILLGISLSPVEVRKVFIELNNWPG